MKYYTKNGREYARVTSIIREGIPNYSLKKWKERTPNHEEISAIAANDGKAFHYYIALELARLGFLDTSTLRVDFTLDYDDELLENRLTAAHRFIAASNPDGPMTAERTLYHEEAGFAGTFDIIMRFDSDALYEDMVWELSHFDFLEPVSDDDVWLIDVKTSGKVYENVSAQLMAYMILIDANGFPDELRPNRIASLRIKDDDDFEFREEDKKKGLRLWTDAWARCVKEGLVH